MSEDIEIPEYVLDHLGQEVRVGDRIVYGALDGRCGTVSVSEVLGFYISGGYVPAVMIKVQGTQRGFKNAVVLKKPGSLIAKYRRFVLLERKSDD